ISEAIRQVAKGMKTLDPGLAFATLDAPANPMTPRECDVLRLAAGGASTVEIAGQLCLTAGTVRNHISSIITKVGARNRVDAIRIADQAGWLGTGDELPAGAATRPGREPPSWLAHARGRPAPSSAGPTSASSGGPVPEDWARTRPVYSPWHDIRDPCVPASTILPLSMTRIRSALRTVLSRCAITMVVEEIASRLAQ